MNISPEQFLNALYNGHSEKQLNKKEDCTIDKIELRKLMSARYGHSYQSATDHLTTDYSNGFTICKKCGSYYHSGNGFTKHLSEGCLHCEGEAKHRVYHVNASKPSEGGFPARWMSQMFDDGMHYCKDKLQKETFIDLLQTLEINKDTAMYAAH